MFSIQPVSRTEAGTDKKPQEAPNEEMEVYGALDGIGAIIIHTIGKILFP